MKYFNALFTVFICSCLVLLNSCNGDNDSVSLDVNAKPFEKISEYAFFKDASDFTKPNKGVIPYRIINSMFRDYSGSDKFIYMPEGKTLGFDSTNLLNPPIGSCFINVVYYLSDERNTTGAKHLIETQLLLRKPTGWEALTYHWSNDQKDATLADNGGSKTISFVDVNGISRQVNFTHPSKSECKSCHLFVNRVTPLGVNAANLNLDISYATGKKNQIDLWAESGLIKNYTSANFTKYPDWKDTTQSLEQRAKAYLNINCAHCHNPGGPANVSGLFLNIDERNNNYGLCKPPQAKGHGTCNLSYDIVPGKPAQSIMVCRLASVEPGVMMPELGRTIIDSAGVSLISQWIMQLKGDCH